MENRLTDPKKRHVSERQRPGRPLGMTDQEIEAFISRGEHAARVEELAADRSFAGAQFRRDLRACILTIFRDAGDDGTKAVSDAARDFYWRSLELRG